MVTKATVNLDAMIRREDFATQGVEATSYETVTTISLRDFTQGGLIGPSLRKPDFQRETNHWSPDQVVSLLECFVNGDLIPSVILWQSSTYLFVIDGGHRLSVLRSWVEDDYGDGPISMPYFAYEISEDQKRTADKTRTLVNQKIGTWQHYQRKAADEGLDSEERRRMTTVVSRGLPIQWVKGNAEKAESSFFKINTKGTPLDEIEELLLKNRRKPVSIAARAIIRAGKGHRYWSAFNGDATDHIEKVARSLHETLFDPEITRPIKTLDLPLGGSKSVRAALETLIELVLISIRDQSGNPSTVATLPDDIDGTSTVRALTRTLSLMRRVTGNEYGSLGLHPAVYFYGPTGRHSSPMFMGTVALLGRKLAVNDKTFFGKFTAVRERLEELLILHKDLISIILQRTASKGRTARYSNLLEKVVDSLNSGRALSDEDLVSFAEMDGKIIAGVSPTKSKAFSDEIKSSAFLSSALISALRCPICRGYLDPEKSVSYDHIVRAREGGTGGTENVQLTHPYCNQSVKA